VTGESRKHPIGQQLILGLILAAGTFLRLWNLGYSDFQGDETKALLRLDPGESLEEFFFGQRKGPLQFVATGLVKLIDPGYSSELLTRLPFALAAVASLWFFYKFVQLNFGIWVATLATFFYATNGLFVSVSRIAQYQSLILLFACLALYFLTKSVQDERWKRRGLYLGFGCWALSALAHYDGLLILPFVLYLLSQHHQRYREPRSWVAPGALLLAMLAAFYVPFVMFLSDSTLDYWSGRLDHGSHTNASSIYVFKIYNPIYVFHFYALFTILGACALLHAFARRQEVIRNAFLLLWLAGVVIFFEVVVTVPGTHIIHYLLPLAILMGLGISFVFRMVKPAVLRAVGAAGLSLMFVFMFLQTNAVFVDGTQEYPWEPENFYTWTFPEVRRDTFKVPIFGFPYDRGWSDIRTYLRTRDDVDSCDSNDKSPILKFYTYPCPHNDQDADVYIWVHRPQSWNPEKRAGRVTDWSATHDPDFVANRHGAAVSEVYVIPDSYGRPVPDRSSPAGE
jgi:hypothetical protein